MNKRNKTLIIISLMMMLLLTACGNNKQVSDSKTISNSSETSVDSNKKSTKSKTEKQEITVEESTVETSAEEETAQAETEATNTETTETTEVEIEEVVQYTDTEVSEEMPAPADESDYQNHTLIGEYKVTWYSPEECGSNIGALGIALTAGYSCAMPDYSMLGKTVLIENYGYYRVEDISPAGIIDIFVNSISDIPSYGVDWQNVYVVE